MSTGRRRSHAGSAKITEEEDTVARLDDGGKEREPFFSFLGNSILGAGKLVLIICANVIAFVALAKLIDMLLVLIHPAITLENILPQDRGRLLDGRL